MIAAFFRAWLDRHIPLQPTDLSQLDLLDGVGSEAREWMDAQ